MGTIKKLAGQTAIYGLSTIVGRLLNYLLVPIYTRIFLPEEYGVVSEFYAYVTFLMIVFTYGMETAFFNFWQKEEDKDKVYSTGVISLLISSVGLALIMILFSGPLASLIKYPKHSEYVSWFGMILALDAMTALPFARLRQLNKPKVFAAAKLFNILVNIFFNIFFLVWCPEWAKEKSGLMSSLANSVYSPQIGVGYVFISNLLSSALTLLLLLPQFRNISFRLDKELWKKMIIYALPLMVAGFAGMINETFDRAIYKYLAPNKSIALAELGIYSACYKLSILMTLFIQTFRYAAEPFFFAQQTKENKNEIYANVMKYFVITCCFIFAGVMLYMDVVKHFIGVKYHSGLKVVPVLLMANMCLGIFFNLSMWYKLSGQTRYGAYFSVFGAVVTIILLVLLIPAMGYMGAAWATLICYAAMMVVSYVTGQKNYPINYDVGRILTYIGLALMVYFASIGIEKILHPGKITSFVINTLLLMAYVGYTFVLEKPKKTNEQREKRKEF